MKKLLILFLFSQISWAHHALEYIQVDGYNTAKKGEVLFHLHYDYMIDNAGDPTLDHWEFTPGFGYGVTDRLMVDVHTHFAKFGTGHLLEPYKTNFASTGSSPFMEAIATVIQYKLTEGWPVNFAIAGTLEIPFQNAKKFLGSEDNVYAAMLIGEYAFGVHSNITLNLSYEIEGDEESSAWAIAAKTPLGKDGHGISGGIEFAGDFELDSWTILPGVYVPVSDGVIVKTGIAVGQEDSQQTLRASLSLMYSF